MLKTTITLFVLLFLISNTDAQWDQKVNNPVQNFEAFWSLFNNNYAFFEDKQINWDSLGQVHRKNISANTNNGALFHTFCEMLKPLNDAHVTLTVSQIDTSFDAARSSRIVDELKPLKKNVRKGFDRWSRQRFTKMDLRI